MWQQTVHQYTNQQAQTNYTNKNVTDSTGKNLPNCCYQKKQWKIF